jgi:hypothetical protein
VRCLEIAASDISNGLGHVGDGHVILQQHRQDRTPRGVGQRGEDGVEGGLMRGGHGKAMHWGGRIVNQMVEYGIWQKFRRGVVSARTPLLSQAEFMI